MRHHRLRGKLSLKTAPRKALISSLACELVRHGRIQTTVDRAKATQRFVERLVTTARKNSLHARRTLIARLRCPVAAESLLAEVAPSLASRNGGYTRVMHFRRRIGDGAQMVLLEFTDPIKRKERQKPEKVKVKKVKKMEKPSAPAPADIQEETERPSEQPSKEKPKKGGFLSGLRKFLKGEE